MAKRSDKKSNAQVKIEIPRAEDLEKPSQEITLHDKEPSVVASREEHYKNHPKFHKYQGDKK